MTFKDDSAYSKLQKENNELKEKLANLELILKEKETLELLLNLLPETVVDFDNELIDEIVEPAIADEVNIFDDDIESEPKLDSYKRDYIRDEQMKLLFDQLI